MHHKTSLSGASKADTVTAADRIAIEELVSRNFYALDGLTALVPGDPAVNWAGNFTPDGVFSIVRANGEVVVEIAGTAALIEAFSHFPDIARTRHWVNNLLIEPVDRDTVDAGCYIIALDIGLNPSPIIRSGVYIDRIVRFDGQWLYASRRLILDPSSPAG